MKTLLLLSLAASLPAFGGDFAATPAWAGSLTGLAAMEASAATAPAAVLPATVGLPTRLADSAVAAGLEAIPSTGEFDGGSEFWWTWSRLLAKPTATDAEFAAFFTDYKGWLDREASLEAARRR